VKLLSLTSISRSSGASWSHSVWRRANPSAKPRRSIRGWWLRPNALRIWPRNGRPWLQVATAALAPSAASMAVRMVAGPVGWAALGVSAGLVLAQMYYSQSDLSAVKTAASTPGGWQVTSTNAGVQTFPGFGTNTPGNPAYPNATIQFSATNVPLCAVDTEYQHDWVVGPFQSLSTAVFFTGNFFVNGPAVGGYSLYVCHRKGIPGSTSPIQDALIPPTQQQVANFVGGLPASDPKSVEAHTNPVGTTGTTQPADTTISQAVTPTEMPTTVKPKPVPAGDIVVVTRSRLRPVRHSRTRNSRRRPRRRRRRRIRTARRRSMKRPKRRPPVPSARMRAGPSGRSCKRIKPSGPRVAYSAR
jgi:hypothetical protein